MKQKDAYELLCKEYLSKCKCCDECVAEIYCIENNLRKRIYPTEDCPQKLKEYFRKGEAMKDEKDCKNCKKSRFIEDDVYECEAETYDIDSKSCYEPKNDRKD